MPKLSRADWFGLIAMLIALVAILLWVWPRGGTTALVGNCPPGTNNGRVAPDTPFRVYWCQPSGDHLEGAYVTGLPGASKVQMANVTITRGPFADDLVQWSGAMPSLARGNYTIQVVAQNYGVANDPTTVQDSAPSAPFALGVADAIGIPAAPVRLRIDAGNPTRAATGQRVDGPFRVP